jgi:hypothetical protein
LLYVYLVKVNFFFTIMMLRFDYIQVLMLAAIPLAAYVKHLNFFSVHHTRSRSTNLLLLLLLLLLL